MATVHVGIVMYNSSSDLPTCLDGLSTQTYPSLRLYALDNASQDASSAWLRRNHPEVILVESRENLGYGRGHNILIRTARLQAGDYYLALNPDVYLKPGYIEQAVRALSMDPCAGWGTGKLMLPEDGSSPKLYSAGHGLYRSGYAINIGFGMIDGPSFSQPREIFGAPGAAVIFRQALIADAAYVNGLFDEQFFLYGEDTDVDWRARLAGWKCLYVPEAVAHHRGSQPGPELRVEAVANRYLSVLKNAFWIDLLFYNLPLILVHIVSRIAVTPRLGIALARSFLGGMTAALRKRQSAHVSRSSMLKWFAWSREQPTGQPRSALERIRAFRMRSTSS